MMISIHHDIFKFNTIKKEGFNMDLNLWIAFGGGFLSFISPCVLPIYPAFISYITGMSYEDIAQKKHFNFKAMLHTLLFLIGFSLVYIALGFGSQFIGGLLIEYKDLIRQIGAILIIVFGLIVVGLFKAEWVVKERKVSFKERPSGFLGTVLIGMAFAAGWTPCQGPIIGAILALSTESPNIAMMMMVSYCIGFSVPFIILSFFITKLSWIRKHHMTITRVGGILMIIMGIILYFDGLTSIISWIQPFFGDFQGF